ncbi:multidrug efflux RND transporter permease subunit MexQ [Pseudomonas aeruginosa]|nr:multidrug efflux RND transporter permease subunit MexQ [Pseudomonas aeruginosa]
MTFPRFFIDRPIFAIVLSVLMMIGGIVSFFQLPLSEYPAVTPPTVQVTTAYPGANPDVIAQTVATPLEQAITGVEGMLYMSSQSATDGRMILTITFDQHIDPDMAQIQVQNRVSRVLSRLPDEVQRQGVVTQKTSPDILMVVHLLSPEQRYDPLYISNYAYLQVRDELLRLPGISDVVVWGAGEYSMRLWLDPDLIAARGLTAGEVIAAVREQNVQVAAGAVGQAPDSTAAFQVTVNTLGRLSDEEQFGDIIVRTGADGQVTRLRDVARIEMGGDAYALRSLLDGEPAVALQIIQSPGANALDTAEAVRATVARLEGNFPAGLSARIAYDPTVFVRASLQTVATTLLEAILLVVVVVVLFLRSWRASLIPLMAVPVSLVGTFAIMHLMGFSLNTLSLFGLVLSIGIVVDDAIVVVENVERHIENGEPPLQAARRAMDEVTGPIMAITSVLAAVFIPTAFLSGLQGEFYRQFALTIAISTILSALNSLTLSPALAGLLLRLGLTWVGFQAVPPGFVPMQDKYYLVGIAQLPNGASLERTDAVVRQMSRIGLDEPGVESVVAFPGLSVNGFVNVPNAAVMFFMLDPFESRTSADLGALAIAGRLQARFASIPDGFLGVFPPPPVPGLGTIGGFKMQVEDRGGAGLEALARQTQVLMMKATESGQLGGLMTSFDINAPQLEVVVDRTKVKSQGVRLADVFEALQVYLGSLYINDFNRFGRTYKVTAQADAPHRMQAEAIGRLQVRNAAGAMLPLSSFVTVAPSSGPDRVIHYNGYPSADISGGALPGVSSGQAVALMERLAGEVLPEGMTFEWTDLTYQQKLAGNSALFIFPLCVLLAYLILAAQYNSWLLPLAVLLIVPMCLLSAIAGVWLVGGDNNVFVQIGLVVLVGLAAKNAILIVEFARTLEAEGARALEAVVEACRLRLRPILMTSLAFIAGVVPLVMASGAGAEMRQAMGVAVFAGMLGVTLFGLFLTPVFYVLVRALAARLERRAGGSLAHLEGGRP